MSLLHRRNSTISPCCLPYILVYVQKEGPHEGRLCPYLINRFRRVSSQNGWTSCSPTSTTRRSATYAEDLRSNWHVPPNQGRPESPAHLPSSSKLTTITAVQTLPLKCSYNLPRLRRQGRVSSRRHKCRLPPPLRRTRRQTRKDSSFPKIRCTSRTLHTSPHLHNLRIH